MYLIPQMRRGTGFSACSHEGLTVTTHRKNANTHKHGWALHKQQALFSTLGFDAICVSWPFATTTKLLS